MVPLIVVVAPPLHWTCLHSRPTQPAPAAEPPLLEKSVPPVPAPPSLPLAPVPALGGLVPSEELPHASMAVPSPPKAIAIARPSIRNFMASPSCGRLARSTAAIPDRGW